MYLLYAIGQCGLPVHPWSLGSEVFQSPANGRQLDLKPLSLSDLAHPSLLAKQTVEVIYISQSSTAQNYLSSLLLGFG